MYSYRGYNYYEFVQFIGVSVIIIMNLYNYRCINGRYFYGCICFYIEGYIQITYYTPITLPPIQV